MSSSSSVAKVCEDGHEVVLPGFRFHPTDEELVGFYLRRKVNKKQLRMELIRETDIYKYDPWDLPKTSDEGDKEWYFFCKRGRKYRNSIRPNRVTASGFWKATGIDRPVYSHGGEGHDCIGLKKTLVYYRGSAGKGTKTDWMMHEFRLPNSVSGDDNNNNVANMITTQPNKSPVNQEAEIWTLCRIFKRNVSHRKYTPDWREMAAKNRGETSSNIILKPFDNDTASERYINFGAPVIDFNTFEVKSSVAAPHANHQLTMHGGVSHDQMSTSSVTLLQPSTMSSSSFSDADVNDDHQFFADGSNWDELRSVVEFALDL